MNVVFYSTNSMRFSVEDVRIQSFPPYRKTWEELARDNPKDAFFIVTQRPGLFLLDAPKAEEGELCRGVRYRITPHEKAADIAADILALNPDIAIAVSFWVAPYDWLPVQDAMIADMVRAHGVRALCHGVQTAMRCFDKYQTHQLLERLGFPVPRAVYVHHELLWCERRHRDMRTNVYKEYVLEQVRQLHFPVVIKDTVGLSSYSLEVATTYRQAVAYLCSGRTTTDRLVEEYLDGEQFGTEIYGSEGKYSVMPPLLLSLNRYGVTSPKQSIKAGPVRGRFVADLQTQLCRLARDLELSGSAQVDLVLHDGQWYILEVNPRVSGMTETYTALHGASVCRFLLDVARGTPPRPDVDGFVLNFKLPIMDDGQLASLAAQPFVCTVHQTHNRAARQEREKGYGELVFKPAPTPEAMRAQLEQFVAAFPQIVEPVFFERAIALLERCGQLSG